MAWIIANFVGMMHLWISFKAVFFYFIVKRDPIYAQFRGRLGDIPMIFFQDPQDMKPFQFLEIFDPSFRKRGWAGLEEGKIFFR